MDKREPLTVSVVDAARMLGISRAFAYELVARGELPSVRLGRRVVIPRRALELLVEEGARSWPA
jgi:excisionase family DNA binding protein